MISATTVTICVLVIALGYYILEKRKSFPPGPWGIPFLGNLLSLEPQLHLSFEKWGKQYGPVVGIKLGQFRAVILDDAKVIREAFSQSAFSGRPDLKLFNFISRGKHGLENSEGPEWTEQRRFTLRKLRDFGFGKKTMESLIMDEVNEVLNWIQANEGKSVSVNRKFSLAVVNALLTILIGKRYDHEDTILKKILDNDSETFSEASKSGWMWFMPILTNWFPQLSGWDKVENAGVPMMKFFEDIVKSRVNAVGSSDSNDFLAAYLEEVKNTTDQNSSFYQQRGRETLAAVLIELFLAGSGTTTTTLAWSILYLMTHPEIQATLQLELDRVTEKQRPPCLADRPNTPYTEAVIQETLRFSSINPFGVFHSTTEDVEFQGYFIPKDTLIIPNLHTVHHDVKVWGDPENFRPSRFITEDENGTTVKKSNTFVPFSVGKRVCVGETLARDQIYLFLTNIFYKFRALPDPADPNPSLQPDGSFILEAKPFTVVFKERFED